MNLDIGFFSTNKADINLPTNTLTFNDNKIETEVFENATQTSIQIADPTIELESII